MCYISNQGSGSGSAISPSPVVGRGRRGTPQRLSGSVAGGRGPCQPPHPIWRLPAKTFPLLSHSINSSLALRKWIADSVSPILAIALTCRRHAWRMFRSSMPSELTPSIRQAFVISGGRMCGCGLGIIPRSTKIFPAYIETVVSRGK
jgi:hypothetical protein